MLTVNMIPTENKNTIHFKQRLLPNCLPHDLKIVTVNGGQSTSQYHTQLAFAKCTGKRKKITSGYFIATPCTFFFNSGLETLLYLHFGVWYVVTDVLDKPTASIFELEVSVHAV